jgi:hypothetical protein
VLDLLQAVVLHSVIKRPSVMFVIFQGSAGSTAFVQKYFYHHHLLFLLGFIVARD